MTSHDGCLCISWQCNTRHWPRLATDWSCLSPVQASPGPGPADTAGSPGHGYSRPGHHSGHITYTDTTHQHCRHKIWCSQFFREEPFFCWITDVFSLCFSPGIFSHELWDKLHRARQTGRAGQTESVMTRPSQPEAAGLTQTGHWTHGAQRLSPADTNPSVFSLSSLKRRNKQFLLKSRENCNM